MQEQLIKILEDRLSLELSTYDNLPFHLAWLYLTLKQSNIIYHHGLYLKYNKIDHLNLTMPYLKEDYLMSSLDNNHFTTYALINDCHPFRHPLYVICRAGVKDKSLKDRIRKDNNNYVYYRHSNLKTLINKICEIHSIENRNIPFKYVLSYLFFNRGKEVKMIYKSGVSTLKYDLQNETIREKDQYHKNSKYYRGVNPYKIIDWYNQQLRVCFFCMCYI